MSPPINGGLGLILVTLSGPGISESVFIPNPLHSYFFGHSAWALEILDTVPPKVPGTKGGIDHQNADDQDQW